MFALLLCWIEQESRTRLSFASLTKSHQVLQTLLNKLPAEERLYGLLSSASPKVWRLSVRLRAPSAPRSSRGPSVKGFTSESWRSCCLRWAAAACLRSSGELQPPSPSSFPSSSPYASSLSSCSPSSYAFCSPPYFPFYLLIYHRLYVLHKCIYFCFFLSHSPLSPSLLPSRSFTSLPPPPPLRSVGLKGRLWLSCVVCVKSSVRSRS